MKRDSSNYYKNSISVLKNSQRKVNQISPKYYYSDFLAIDENDTRRLVKIKDDDNPDPKIKEKNQVVKEWVNTLNLDLRRRSPKKMKIFICH